MPATDLSMKANSVREREQLIAEGLRSGRSRQDLADELGYADDSAVTKVHERLLKRATVNDVQIQITEELDRLNALTQTLWASARRGDLGAIDRLLKIMDRRSKYLGLDFLDGIAERHVEIQEAQLQILATVLRACFGDSRLNLTEEQVAVVPEIVRSHLNEISAA